MARRYSKKASAKVGRAMKRRKAGTLKSGRWTEGQEPQAGDRDRAFRGTKEGRQGAKEIFEKAEGEAVTANGLFNLLSAAAPPHTAISLRFEDVISRSSKRAARSEIAKLWPQMTPFEIDSGWAKARLRGAHHLSAI